MQYWRGLVLGEKKCSSSSLALTLEYYIVILDISSMLLFVTASLTVNSDVYYHSVYCNVYSDNIMYERFCQTSLCLRSMRIFPPFE